MFGNPEWFKLTTCCQGVSPVNHKGWAYLAAWAMFIILPIVGLASLGKGVPEGPIWLAFSGLAFYWDLREMRRRLKAVHDRNLFYIGDEQEASAEFATRHFDMKLRE